MKKLLTVSLVAVMAVSAAHAEIASTNYVDNKVTPVATKVGSADFKNAVIAKDAADVTVAVTALDTKLNEVASGTGLTLGANAVNTDNIVNGAVTLGKVGDDVKGSIAEAKKAGTDASDMVKALNQNSAATEGSFVSGVSQSEGKITESLTQFAPTVSAGGKIAPTAGAVYTAVEGAKSYTDTKVGELGDKGSAVEYVNARFEVLEKNIDDTNSGLEQSIEDLGSAIATEQQRAEGVEAGLDTAVKAAQKAADDEKSRAEGVEAGLAEDIADETTRAKAAEEKIAKYDDQGNLTGGSVKDNADDIAELDNTKQVKSGADYVIGMTNGQWKALTELAQAVDACKGKQCALTVNDGDIKWEEVVNQ